MINRIIVGAFSTNCYLYETIKGKCAIIDPGDNAPLILSEIEKKELIPEIIICTHGHFDHILAVSQLINHYRTMGKELPLAIGAMEGLFFGEKSLQIHQESLLSVGLPPSLFPPESSLTAPTYLLKEGETVPFTDLKVIETPGHSKGSISLLSSENRLLFSGDCLFAQGIGRTDLRGGSHSEILNSIIQKLFTLDETIKVYPGHGPSGILSEIIQYF